MSLFMVLKLVWFEYWFQEFPVLLWKKVLLYTCSFFKTQSHWQAPTHSVNKTLQTVRTFPFCRIFFGKMMKFATRMRFVCICKRQLRLILIWSRCNGGRWTRNDLRKWWSWQSPCCWRWTRHCLARVRTHWPEIWLAATTQASMTVL